MNCEDPNALDSQPHLLHCKELAKFLGSDEFLRTKGVKYEDIFGSLEEQKEVVLTEKIRMVIDTMGVTVFQVS